MGSGAMMHIPRLIKFGSGIQKLLGVVTHRDAFIFFNIRKVETELLVLHKVLHVNSLILPYPIFAHVSCREIR
jgi:hypothetical protein